MQILRNAHLIARFVLVWFALTVGAAIASPLLKPQSFDLICSGSGVIKIMPKSDDGKAPGAGLMLDCPLCASISAPPPMDIVVFGLSQPAAFVAPHVFAEVPRQTLATPPPARAPPALS